MTTTDLAVRDTAHLPQKIEYARFLAKSGLLPREYQEKPANVLFAYEYGELLGLHPIAAITGIHVIDGKPSIGASLIAALVRRAGHKLRVEDNGQAARCQIWRTDDPGFAYSATWDMGRAKQAGLLGRTNWQRYPAAMRKARAISECARDACPEVLLGLNYTPDELGGEDDGGEIIHDGWPTAANGMVDGSRLSEDEKDAAGLMTRQQRISHAQLQEMTDVDPGEVAISSEPDEADPWAEPGRPKRRASQAALGTLNDYLANLALGPAEDVHALFAWVLGQPYEATPSHVSKVTKWIESHLEAAQGDFGKAATAIWEQHARAQKGAGGE